MITYNIRIHVMQDNITNCHNSVVCDFCLGNFISTNSSGSFCCSLKLLKNYLLNNNIENVQRQQKRLAKIVTAFIFKCDNAQVWHFLIWESSEPEIKLSELKSMGMQGPKTV